jgi:hypothetical protein
MKIRLLSILTLLLLNLRPLFAEIIESTHSDISLKVEYTPKNEIDLYEPFLIMISITNSGIKSELVPVTDSSDRGYRFHIRDTKTGEIYTTGLEGDRIGTKVAWVKPNDRYLFFEWVYYAIPIEGEFEIFATLESDGKCPLLLSGIEEFPLELLDSRPYASVYKCWEGKLISNNISIKIQRPKDEFENNVLNKVEEKAPKGAGTGEKLLASYTDLRNTNPLSEYTCFASFHVGPEDAYQTCTNIQSIDKDVEILARFKMALKTIFDDSVPSEDELNKMPSVFQDYLKQFQKEHEEQKKRDAVMHNK